MKKIAFYGLGSTGMEHIRAFRKTELFDIVSVCSRTEKRASEKAAEIGVPFSRNVAEIYTKYQPDLLVICVPPDAVMEVTTQAMEFPWEIFVEKPAGLNYSESLELMEKAKINNKENQIWVGMNRRMLPSTIRSRELLNLYQNNRKSKIEINIVDQQDTVEATKYGHPKNVIENWHFANSIHLIDLGLNFLGELPLVESVSKENFLNGEILTAKIITAKGNILNYKSYWNIPAPWSLEIISNDGWIQQTPIEKLRTLFDIHEVHSFKDFEYREPNDTKPGFFNQAKALSDRFPSLKEMLCTLKQSHSHMKIVDEIYAQ